MSQCKVTFKQVNNRYPEFFWSSIDNNVTLMIDKSTHLINVSIFFEMYGNGKSYSEWRYGKNAKFVTKLIS